MIFLMASHGAYSNFGTQLGDPEQEILDWHAGEVIQQPFSWIQCIRLQCPEDKNAPSQHKGS